MCLEKVYEKKVKRDFRKNVKALERLIDSTNVIILEEIKNSEKAVKRRQEVYN